MNHAEILRHDLKKLRTLGFDPESSKDQDLQFACSMLESYQRAGEFDHLAQFTSPDKTSIDVGANLGYYTLKLAVLSKKVLSIEPVEGYEWLGQVLPENCTFANCAAGARQEYLTLRVPVIAGQPQYGMATLTDNAIFGVLKYHHHRVPVFPLDQLVRDHLPDERIGFIKIDVEGFEHEVIAGADDILKQHQPNLQVEITPEEVQNTAAYFETLGYTGCFFFNHQKLDISAFDPALHHAQPDWEEDVSNSDPSCGPVDNFFFTPTH